MRQQRQQFHIQPIDCILCAMLEPIKKEVKMEEKKRGGEMRAVWTKVFDVYSHPVDFKDVYIHLLTIKRKFFALGRIKKSEQHHTDSVWLSRTSMYIVESILVISSLIYPYKQL